VRHVFVIALAGAGYQAAFGPGAASTYLAQLRQKGALLSGFAPIDGAELPNYLAFAGGQPPNAATRAECATFADFPAGAAPAKDGVVPGDGCIYPNTVLSLGDQVTASGGLWRAYLQDLDAGPDHAASCRHPAVGAADGTLQPRPSDSYATRHNPFVYFHSLLDLGDCQADDLPLTKLSADLATEKTTPELAYLAPGAGADADAFLRQWVPPILASPGYRHGGVLAVAFLSGPAPTGALLLSPFAQKGALYAQPYDPYSLLRSIEDLLALEPLAKAAKAKSFARVALRPAFR
jgi:hypothetical protein